MTYINLDMDGTFVDLYGVDGWLDYIIKEDTKPYTMAKPLVNLSVLARLLNKAQRKGYGLAVISWTAKNGSKEYNEAVANAKKAWLAKHLPSVRFDEITIADYGMKKDNFRKSADDVLFDDEEPNRKTWNGKAYNADNLIKVLKAL